MVENVIGDIKKIKDTQEDLEKKEFKNKYTNQSDTRGWSRSGIKRFNSVYKIVKQFENKLKDLDEVMQQHFRKYCKIEKKSENEYEGENSKLVYVYDSEDSDVFGIYEASNVTEL